MLLLTLPTSGDTRAHMKKPRFVCKSCFNTAFVPKNVTTWTAECIPLMAVGGGGVVTLYKHLVSSNRYAAVKRCSESCFYRCMEVRAVGTDWALGILFLVVGVPIFYAKSHCIIMSDCYIICASQ